MLSKFKYSQSRTQHPGKIPTDRNFGIVFAILFTVIALFPLRHGGPVRIWCLACSGFLLLVTLLRPSILNLPNVLWTRFGLIVSAVTTPIFCWVVFFLLFTPIAIVLRWIGADFMRRKYQPTDSYWIARVPPGPDPADMPNQF